MFLDWAGGWIQFPHIPQEPRCLARPFANKKNMEKTHANVSMDQFSCFIPRHIFCRVNLLVQSDSKHCFNLSAMMSDSCRRLLSWRSPKPQPLPQPSICSHEHSSTQKIWQMILKCLDRWNKCWKRIVSFLAHIDPYPSLPTSKASCKMGLGSACLRADVGLLAKPWYPCDVHIICPKTHDIETSHCTYSGSVKCCKMCKINTSYLNHIWWYRLVELQPQIIQYHCLNALTWQRLVLMMLPVIK